MIGQREILTPTDDLFPPQSGCLINDPLRNSEECLEIRVHDLAETPYSAIEAAKIAVSSVWQESNLPPDRVDMIFAPQFRVQTDGGPIHPCAVYNDPRNIIYFGTNTIKDCMPPAPFDIQVFLAAGHEMFHKVQCTRGDMLPDGATGFADNSYYSRKHELEAHDAAARAYARHYPHLEWKFSMGLKDYDIRARI